MRSIFEFCMVEYDIRDSISSHKPIPPITFPSTRTPLAEPGHHLLDTAIIPTAIKHMLKLSAHRRPIFPGKGDVRYVKARRVFQMDKVRKKARKLTPIVETVPDWRK